MEENKKLLTTFANRYGVEENLLFNTLQSTAFSQGKDDHGNVIAPSKAQMMGLLIVADQYELNPFTKEIFAYPDKNRGVIPVVSVDGWAKLINSNKNFDGMEFKTSKETVTVDEHHKTAPEWMECKIYRKDRSHPIVVSEYFEEVYRPPFIKNKGQKNQWMIPGPWQTHTRRMLRHKVMIQCARLAFSFAGIYDEDEAERIKESDVIDIPAEDYSDIEQKQELPTEDEMIKSLGTVTDQIEIDSIIDMLGGIKPSKKLSTAIDGAQLRLEENGKGADNEQE